MGALVLLRNSARDGRKGDKLAQRWFGPYQVHEHMGKGVYRLKNPSTGHVLKKTYNSRRYIYSITCIVMILFALID